MTLARLLHNKPIADDIVAHLALAEMVRIHIAPLILQRLCNTLPAKREDVIWCFFETMSSITGLTIEGAPYADPKRPASTFYRSPC